MIKLIVSGCCGKMGARIIALAKEDQEFLLVGALERPGHPDIGKKCGDISITDDPEVIKAGDVLIEFTAPQGTITHLGYARKYQKAMVIGSTGLDQQQIQQIQKAADFVPIVFSPNMSWGVNIMFRIVNEAAKRLGEDYRVDIQEAHHQHKKDAPSGTAKRLAEIIKQSKAAQQGDIPIDAIREGEIVGDHQVRFDGPEDTLIIKHSAKTRDIFARGALAAAKFIVDQDPGMYGMQNVIESQ